MGLKNFLTASNFSHDREAMLVHQLIYDCMLVFAKLESRLQVLTSEVDHDGYDVVLDDGDIWKRFQIKSVFGKTSSWEIHRRLLRPTPYDVEVFGFEPSFQGSGICGGVILQEVKIDSKGALEFKYLYTDIYILRGLSMGIIVPDNQKSQNSIEKLFNDLKKGNGTISIPKGAFLRAKDLASLLGLAGFNTGICNSPWQRWLKILSARKAGNEHILPAHMKELPTTDEAVTIKLIQEKLSELRPNQSRS